MPIGKITVGRVNALKTDHTNIRVDRKSALGNPYYMANESMRDDVCNKYQAYLDKSTTTDNPKIMTELKHIYDEVKKGNNVNLQCWCAPKRCHADSIKALIESEIQKENIPMNKLIIAGGRDFTDMAKMDDAIREVMELEDLDKSTIILCGGARGADTLGEQWATNNGYEIEHHPALWDLFGKSAGMRRNAEMAKSGTHLLAFWDGKSKGTNHMIEFAFEKGLVVYTEKYP